MTLDFGLQISRFGFPGAPGRRPPRALAEIARAAEEAGFTSLWVMDHFLQIPQIGREWEDMLESYATLAYLAGVTERIRLGTLVTGVTYRNLAHLGKLVATLDVLSGGRALCGHRRRLVRARARALRLAVPAAGASASRGWRTRSSCSRSCGARARRASRAARSRSRRPSATRGRCRSGSRSSSAASGERRTLRLVARHADACNLFGDPARVRHKVARAARALRRGGPRPGRGARHPPRRRPRRRGRRAARGPGRGDRRGARRPLPRAGRGRRRRPRSSRWATPAGPSRSAASPT